MRCSLFGGRPRAAHPAKPPPLVPQGLSELPAAFSSQQLDELSRSPPASPRPPPLQMSAIAVDADDGWRDDGAGAVSIPTVGPDGDAGAVIPPGAQIEVQRPPGAIQPYVQPGSYSARIRRAGTVAPSYIVHNGKRFNRLAPLMPISPHASPRGSPPPSPHGQHPPHVQGQHPLRPQAQVVFPGRSPAAGGNYTMRTPNPPRDIPPPAARIRPVRRHMSV